MPSPQEPVFVLVHGAWHTGEGWSTLNKFLHAAGYETVCPTLPSVNASPPLESHVADADAVRAVMMPLIERGRQIVLVGHSYGGQVISEAANGLSQNHSQNGGGISHLVYCAAYALLPGESLASLDDGFPRTAPQFVTASEDGKTLSLIENRKIPTFYADVDPKLAEEIGESVGTQSAETFLSKLSDNSWKDIPTTYIYCTQDVALAPAKQRHMYQRIPNVRLETLETCHSPFLSRPEEMSAILRRAAGDDV